jgi:putative membrane protein
MLDFTFDTANSSLSQVFESFGIEAPQLTPETYASVIDGVIAAYPQAGGELEVLKTQLEAAVGFYNGVVEYTQGVSTIHQGAEALGQGAVMLKDGLYELSSSITSITSGAGELSLGMYALRGGFEELVAGSGRLRAETGGIEEKAKAQIALFVDDMTQKYSGEFKPVSFVSDKNSNIRAVQFVFKTQGIETEKAEAEAPVAAEKLNLWQRILKLFGIK